MPQQEHKRVPTALIVALFLLAVLSPLMFPLYAWYSTCGWPY